MSGQGFLKDLKAFGSRPSLAEVHSPLHFLSSLDLGEFHDSGGGDPPLWVGPAEKGPVFFRAHRLWAGPAEKGSQFLFFART